MSNEPRKRPRNDDGTFIRESYTESEVKRLMANPNRLSEAEYQAVMKAVKQNKIREDLPEEYKRDRLVKRTYTEAEVEELMSRAAQLSDEEYEAVRSAVREGRVTKE